VCGGVVVTMVVLYGAVVLDRCSWLRRYCRCCCCGTEMRMGSTIETVVDSHDCCVADTPRRTIDAVVVFVVVVVNHSLVRIGTTTEMAGYSEKRPLWW